MVEEHAVALHRAQRPAKVGAHQPLVIAVQEGLGDDGGPAGGLGGASPGDLHHQVPVQKPPGLQALGPDIPGRHFPPAAGADLRDVRPPEAVDRLDAAALRALPPPVPAEGVLNELGEGPPPPPPGVRTVDDPLPEQGLGLLPQVGADPVVELDLGVQRVQDAGNPGLHAGVGGNAHLDAPHSGAGDLLEGGPAAHGLDAVPVAAQQVVEKQGGHAGVGHNALEALVGAQVVFRDGHVPDGGPGGEQDGALGHDPGGAAVQPRLGDAPLPPADVAAGASRQVLGGEPGDLAVVIVLPAGGGGGPAHNLPQVGQRCRFPFSHRSGP